MKIAFTLPNPIAFLLIVFLIGTGISCKNQKENTSSKSDTQSPCELLTETEIKTALAIPEKTETSMEEKSTTYPSCFYEWESITWPYEITGGRTAEHPAEMSIVMVNNINKEQYETSVSYYKDGEAVNGIGDMATWTEKMSQLSFLYKGKLIHVHVKTSADVASNKEKSIKMAKLIANKL